MLGKFPWWRHLVVLISVLVGAGLALFGVIGAGNRGERFDAKQVVVQPAGVDGLRIREVVDQDFGSNERRGYQRIIPNDFGVPTEVTAESPDAPDDLSVENLGSETRIRIGDPDVTLTGQHRYVLTYTLPEAMMSLGLLQLDVIGTDEELETGRFEVIVAGMELANTQCSVGSFGDEGGCDLVQDDDVYRVVFEPLEPGQGITIGGDVVRTFEPEQVPIPEIPDRRPDRRGLVMAAIAGLGVVVGALVFARARQRGANEVFAGGAAEAAYGDLPAPLADGTVPAAKTVLVPDDKMDELATIEFVPPKGVEPWEGQVLLRERVDDDTVSAWFSGLVAKEAIVLEKDDDDKVVMIAGPRRGEVDPDTAAHLANILGSTGRIVLGKYDEDFSQSWASVQNEQLERIRASGWWKRFPSGGGCGASLLFVAAIVAAGFFGFGTIFAAALGAFEHPVVAVVAFGVVLPFVLANAAYASLRAVRSATGSALALRTESFRRFLEASEARHVEWAWSQGLLREYSAWAVALDTADAWEDALKRSNLPPDVRTDMTTPLLVHSMGSSFHSSHTAPSSSGSGGGGGFSGGGSVGGGGGGGSSGSW